MSLLQSRSFSWLFSAVGLLWPRLLHSAGREWMVNRPRAAVNFCGATIILSPFLWLSALPWGQTPDLQSVLSYPDRFLERRSVRVFMRRHYVRRLSLDVLLLLPDFQSPPFCSNLIIPHLTPVVTLSSLTINGFWIDKRIYWTLATRDYNLQFTRTRTKSSLSSVSSLVIVWL
jgi:hypothetical protein